MAKSVSKKKVVKTKTASKSKIVNKKAIVRKKIPSKKSKAKKTASVKNSKKNTAKNVNSKMIKSTNKRLQKSINANKKENVSQNKEIEKLKQTVLDLKKKKKSSTRRVSEYNLFIRKQILSGLTFEKAVKEWNKFKKLELKQKRKPSAYNQFIGSQMKLGRTFTESVRLWKIAKEGKLGRKGTTRTITKTVVKKVKSKPKIVVRKVMSKPKIVEKIKYRTRTKEVPKKCPPKKIIERKELDYEKLKTMLSSTITEVNRKSISVNDVKKAVDADDEEIAFKLVQTYFIEIARFGFKKRLTLDEIIDAYFYSLARVKKNDPDFLEISQRVKNSGVKK
jgi:hypothetical protein